MPQTDRKQDFSVPLTTKQHEDLKKIAETLGDRVGAKVSRRDIASRALGEFIAKKLIEMGL